MKCLVFFVCFFVCFFFLQNSKFALLDVIIEFDLANKNAIDSSTFFKMLILVYGFLRKLTKKNNKKSKHISQNNYLKITSIFAHFVQ